MKVTKLKPNPNNPRLIRDDKFQKLVKSIQDFPEMMEKRPIVCVTDADGLLYPLGGNMRLRAIQELKMKDIPDSWVLIADDWTEEQRKQFVIKDNVGFGEWNWEQLANEWDESQLSDWGLDLPEFQMEELQAEEDDFNEAPPENPITVFGDLYEIGEHHLLCGDSTDSNQVAKLMNGSKADMVFTDPDYSMNDDDLFSCYSNEKLINPDVSFWVCGDKQAIKLATNDIERFTHFFVHDFKCATLVSNTQPMQRHNLICKFGNKKMINLEDGFTTIVSIATERTLENHKLTPMSKRVELPAKFIEHYADKNGIVFDFFIHSGSTMVAAHQLKRKCYGIELEPKYCDFIVRRMLKLDPNLTIKRNGVDCKAEFLNESN